MIHPGGLCHVNARDPTREDDVTFLTLTVLSCTASDETCADGYAMTAEGNCELVAESDTDTDTDADTDADTDTDTDTDVDTGPPGGDTGAGSTASATVSGTVSDGVGTVAGDVSVEFWNSALLDASGYPDHAKFFAVGETVKLTAGGSASYTLTVVPPSESTAEVGYVFAFFDTDGDGHYATNVWGMHASQLTVSDGDAQTGADITLDTEG